MWSKTPSTSRCTPLHNAHPMVNYIRLSFLSLSLWENYTKKKKVLHHSPQHHFFLSFWFLECEIQKRVLKYQAFKHVE